MMGTIEVPLTTAPHPDETHHQHSRSSTPICLKKKMGLLEGVTVIIGSTIGSGIFVSPKGVFAIAESVGLTLIVWAASGILTTIGALCYAELGTMIPESGGPYSYLLESLGPLPAFLGMWVMIMIRHSTSLAIQALTFSTYLVQALMPDCQTLPQVPIKLLAALLIGFLTLVNCVNVRWSVKVQNVFTASKVLALTVIIMVGTTHLGRGNIHNYISPLDGSNWSAAAIATATYHSLYSYSGWENVCYMVEELKDIKRNLPRAIVTSLLLVTVIYTLTNAAYLAVLDRTQMLSSDAVALTFGQMTLGVMAWVMPLFVILNVISSTNGFILSRSRLLYVVARRGQIPEAFSLLQINKFTPVPALVLNGLMAILMLPWYDIMQLVQYTTFAFNVLTLSNALGLLWLRYKEPHRPRPYKVCLVFPVLFVMMQVFLLSLPIIYNPATVGISVAIVALGLPVYYIGIHRQDLASYLSRPIRKVTIFFQLLFLAAPEEKGD